MGGSQVNAQSKGLPLNRSRGCPTSIHYGVTRSRFLILSEPPIWELQYSYGSCNTASILCFLILPCDA